MNQGADKEGEEMIERSLGGIDLDIMHGKKKSILMSKVACND